MMKQEFEMLAGYAVSQEDYNKIIEPMYMATNLSKEDFIKCVDRKRFEYIAPKSIAQQELEDSINEMLRDLESNLGYSQRCMATVKGCLEELPGDEFYLGSLKYWKTRIKDIKSQIKELKFIISA